MTPLPVGANELVDAFLAQLDTRVPELVTDVYLHGSLCWGEWFRDSDLDFVVVTTHRPDRHDLRALVDVHQQLRATFPDRRLEGFYALASDLGDRPADVPPLPVHHESEFRPRGHLDVNPVTWHELSERPIVVRGAAPAVNSDIERVVAYTRDNLIAYWRDSQLRQIKLAGARRVGARDDAVVWVVLGVARLHHVLARRQITSKSGAGRYVLASIDSRWHAIAREALSLRETPGQPSTYDSHSARGRDVRAFLEWAIEDGLSL